MIAAVVLVSGPSVPRDHIKKDLESLQGSWVIVGKEFMGKKATEKELADLKGEMVIKNATITQWAEEEGKKFVVSRSTFKLDPKAKPKRVDLTYINGKLKGRTFLAIYELNKDTLIVCYTL
jgi:uncharacterized protein (TIGR03067 family)